MRVRIVISFFLFLIAVGSLSIRMMGIAMQPPGPNHATVQRTVAHSRGVILDRNGLPIVHAQREYYTAYLQGNEVQLAVYPRYGTPQAASHLIGHLNANGAGALGLERAFEDLLGNYAGGTLALRLGVDARGQAIAGAQLQVHRDNFLSPAGIQLTIDLRIQEIVEQAMQYDELTPGAVIVLCNETMEVLALASSPRFDPNDIANSLGCLHEPFFNRALGAYAIGSTFKTFIAAAALDQNIPAGRTHFCLGHTVVAGRTVRCFNETAHGYVDMQQALAQSCNVYFIELTRDMQTQPMLDLLYLFGFGSQTYLVDGVVGARGNLPTARQLVLPGELANFSFGQGLLLGTPMQMAVATAIIANGGIYRTPTLLKATIDSEGNATPFANQTKTRQVISPRQAEILREMMIFTVEEGTGLIAKPRLGSAGGKTATAQSGHVGAHGREILQTSFTGFFPAEHPRVTIMVFREDGESGGRDCGPVFRAIADGLIEAGLAF